ncbi:MAG: thioredoxin domain-containing protein [Candidatus Nanoarchaeia archaeon]|nr:thioredoxin domain-containing protein [Candidatus Nanoarchaeia archaeon]
MAKKRLLFFTGRECPHCHEMEPLITKLEKELKVKVTKLEVWHNSKNAKLLKDLDKGYCGGVPFFYNENNDKWICGAVPYSKLKAWAK